MDSKRKRRSYNAMKQAFIALLNKMPYDEITVKDILDESTYSRKTFYAYFSSKSDIAPQILEDEANTFIACYTQLIPRRKKLSRQSIQDAVRYGVAQYFSHVYKNQDLYRTISRATVPGLSFDLLVWQIYSKSKALYDVKQLVENLDVDLYAYQWSHILVNYLSYWANHDFEQPPEYMASQSVYFLHNAEAHPFNLELVP